MMKQPILNSKFLQSNRLVYLFLALALVGGMTFGVLYLRNTAGITMINPSNPPKPILEDPELEKLVALQNAQDVFLVSGVSPDDSTIIVAWGSSEESGSRQASWMDIQTGELEPIPAEFLQLFPQSTIAWSNDGSVVYVSNNSSGDPVLVMLDRTSNEIKSEALPLNGKPLSLAPNGSRLLVEVGSKEGIDLMVSNLETGESEKLLSYLSGGGPQSIAWTDDGSKLALVRYEAPNELVSDQAKINELITQDALGKLPLDQNPLFMGNIVDVFDLEQGEHTPSTLHTESSDGYLFHKVLWSPDGQRLITRMIHPSQPAGREFPVVVVGAFPDRALYRIYDASLTLTNTLDRPEIEAPLTSSAIFLSSEEVIVTAAHELNLHLYYFNLLSDEFRQLPSGEGTFEFLPPDSYQVYATHRSRQLIYNQSSFQHPADVYRLDLDGSEPQALTQFNAKAAAANQIRVDEVSFQLDEDTTRIGYLLQPADALFPPQNIPIVLYQQGGPGGAMTNRWGATAEEPFSLLPNFGIAVLFMPFSGREGFGPEFFNALADNNNFGQRDVEEGAQVVRYLLEQNYASPGSVGIVGASYGGYFAAQSIIQYPDLYAAANVQSAVLDMIKWWEPNPFLVTYLQGSVPADQMDEYRRDSPYYSASKIKTPLLLFHGKDDNLPFQIVRDFRNGIDDDKTPSKMLVFKNEGHSLSSSSSRLIAAQEQIAWFRKYLVP